MLVENDVSLLSPIPLSLKGADILSDFHACLPLAKPPAAGGMFRIILPTQGTAPTHKEDFQGEIWHLIILGTLDIEGNHDLYLHLLPTLKNTKLCCMRGN